MILVYHISSDSAIKKVIFYAPYPMHVELNLTYGLYFFNSRISFGIESCLSFDVLYVTLSHMSIVAGLGVIENDFHNRKDLAPNVCAVYTEEDCRCKGIAGKL